MLEELSAVREQFEILVNEHKAALQDAKSVARNEIKKELEELERRLASSNNMEATLTVCKPNASVIACLGP